MNRFIPFNGRCLHFFGALQRSTTFSSLSYIDNNSPSSSTLFIARSIANSSVVRHHCNGSHNNNNNNNGNLHRHQHQTSRACSRIAPKVAPTPTLTEPNVNERTLVESLSEIVGPNSISLSGQIRTQHGKDESHFGAHLADIVVWPQTTEQVSRVHKLCYELNVPITPFGTGTGLEGGVNALNGGVCVALTKMDKMIEINSEDFDCTVQAGVTWRDLNKHLHGTGLFFPVDPGASASLGGMASTNASGTNAMYYGTMKQNVLNLEVVLPSGEIIKTSGTNARARKSAAGLNLTELFVGSEGILGTITAVTLRLYPMPETLCACVCHFDDDQTTIDTVIELLQNNIPLSRIEYLDSVSIGAANAYSKMDLPEKPSLFMEICGNQSDIEPIVKLTKEIITSNGGENFHHSTKNEERTKLWKARHSLYYACRQTRPGHHVLITDVCVPISQLTKVIVQMREYLQQNQLNGFLNGHVGDGNFHSIITYDETDQDECKRVFEVAEKIAEYAISLGGTCTGEHGIGRGKMHLLQKQFDHNTMEVMRSLKCALDPKRLINNGKVLKIED